MKKHGCFRTTRFQSVGCESFQVDDFISGPKGAELSRAAAREPLTGLASHLLQLQQAPGWKQAARCSVPCVQNLPSNAPNDLPQGLLR